MPNRSTASKSEVRVPLLPEWCAAVRAELKRRGIGVREFARQLDLPYPTVRALVNGRGKTSPLVPRIAEALGVPYAGEQVVAHDEVELLRLARALKSKSPELLEGFIALLEQQSKALSRPDDD